MKKKFHPIKFHEVTALEVHHYEEGILHVTKIRIDDDFGNVMMIELRTVGEPRFLSFFRKEIKIKYEGGHNDEERIRKQVASFKVEDQSDEDTKVIDKED